MKSNAEFGSDDASQCGLAQTGRAGEKQMIDGLLPTPGGLKDDPEMFLEFALTDELLEMTGTEPTLLADDIANDIRCATR
jgi:hypothetical protein